jgi:Tol biopolymer transport system component
MKAFLQKAATASTLCMVVGFLLATPAQAAFPGDNGRIAFHAQEVGTYDFRVETIQPDGSSRSVVAQSPGQQVAPAWTAKGDRIAFTQAPAEPGAVSEVFAINPDGTGQTRLTYENGSESAYNPSWSPDGTRVAFERYFPAMFGGFTWITVANADGSGETQIGEGRYGRDTRPAWSPDGSKIAFQRERGIYTMNPDGSDETLITGQDVAGHPNWSPDGTKIAFASPRDDPDPANCTSCNWEIYTVNAGGTGLMRVTNNPGYDLHPAWSPDGTKIVFDFNDDIFTINVDGTGRTNVTLSPTIREGEPDWQPLPGPSPADFKNTAQFCKAERTRLGDSTFKTKYGNNGGCVNWARGN